MGCGGSKPEAAPTPKHVVSSAEMDAVKAKLAESAAKQAESESTGETGQQPFERKFKGYKAKGGEKHSGTHKVQRRASNDPSAQKEVAEINARIAKKKAEKEAKEAAKRAEAAEKPAGLFRSLTRGKSFGSARSLTRSFSRKPRNSGSSSGSGRSLRRTLTRGLSGFFGASSGSLGSPGSRGSKTKDPGEEPTQLMPSADDAEGATPTGGSKTGSGKHVGFAAAEGDALAA